MAVSGGTVSLLVQGDRVQLRDRRADDLEDYVRWFSPGQEWQKWDAPWEALDEFNDETRRHWLERLNRPLPVPRRRMEIETSDDRHIGWVNSYWVDKVSRWRDCGIVIAEEDLWGQGLGREAFSLWIGYQLDAFDLPRIGMGTWSGNVRMQRIAARVGMREEARFDDARVVGGRRYDAVRWGLTRADWDRFHAPRENGLHRYAPADWASAIELIRELFNTHRAIQGAPQLTLADARDTLFGWLVRRDSVLWVWQELGDVVGLARARYAGVCFFEEFVVAEGHRGQGIGSRFLLALEDELRSAGERDVFLSMVWPGNPRAIDFYRHHGYDVVNTFELRKGLDRDRRGSEITFLRRRFHLSDSVPAAQPLL